MERTQSIALVALVTGVAVGVAAGWWLAPKPTPSQTVTATYVLADAAAPTPSPRRGDASPPEATTPAATHSRVVTKVLIDGPAAQGHYVVLVDEPAEPACARPASAFVQPIDSGKASIQFDPSLAATQHVRVLTSLAANTFGDVIKAPCLMTELSPAPEGGARARGYAYVSAEQGLASVGCNTSKPPNFRFRLCLDPRSGLQLGLSGVSDVR